MSGTRQSGKGPAGEDAELVGDVHEALLAMGWVAPQREADVRRAEEDLPAQPAPPLPEALRDPQAVFDRPDGRADTPPVLPLPAGADDIEATLNRAAREGGRITPEIDQAMRRDRQAAERDMDDEPQTG